MALQATDGGYVIPPPPYPYNTVHTPLSSVEKSVILAYLKQFWAVSAGGTDPSGGLTSPTFPDFTNYSAQSIINAYNSIVGNTPTPPGADPGTAQAGIGPVGNLVPGITNPFKSVTDFLNVLGKQETWIRVAEFAIGGLLLAIGINAMLRSGSGGQVYQSTKQTASTGSTIAKAVVK